MSTDMCCSCDKQNKHHHPQNLAKQPFGLSLCYCMFTPMCLLGSVDALADTVLIPILG